MDADKNKNVLEAGDGSEQVWTDLFGRHYRILVFFASRLLNDRFQAEDVVQEVFLKLYEKPLELRNDQALKPYLFTSIRNRCLDLLKHRQTRDNYQSAYTPAPAEEYIHASMVEAEALSMLAQGVERLPAECRKVMELSMEGLTSVEIAARLNVAPSTVRAQKSRGIKLLKEMLPGELWSMILLFFAI